jgi:hypothetical protein
MSAEAVDDETFVAGEAAVDTTLAGALVIGASVFTIAFSDWRSGAHGTSGTAGKGV